MFMPPPAARSRPLFAVSLAAHAALLAALAVPSLLATPDPPEPDGFVRIDSIPVLMSDAPVRDKVDLPGKGMRGGDTRAAGVRTSDAAAARPSLTQPSALTELLPAPTGEEPQSPFEEPGEQSEPGIAGRGRGDGADGGDPAGCEGCAVVSATAPGVTPPVALESAALAYPELARRARVEGIVFLEAIIGADGSVRNVRVLRGAHPLLDPAALEAVRRWRYRPARIGERSVAVYLNVVVTFSLRNL